MFHLFSEMKVEEYFIPNVWIQVKNHQNFYQSSKDKVIEYNFHSTVTEVKDC